MITKKEESLDFLKKKIQEIRLAKFSAEINSLLQLPNNVISTLKTDNDGNIWFFTSCNGIYADNMDKDFYASLEYYTKGSDCHLHIDGTATIVDNEEDMHPFTITRNNFAYDVVLVKLKIIKAEYYEAREVFTTSFKETIRNIFVQLFYSDSHKQFNFFEAVPNDF